MELSPLDRKADYALLDRLHKEGLLNEYAYQACCKALTPVTTDWYPWARRILLYMGSGLVLAGIIFFFAYNWAGMGKFLKFGLIEAGIIGCTAGAFLYGINKLSSKIMLLCASVLVGVLLAVFGQTYQTGADAYELFTGWAMLILGWVIISKFAALWFVWLVILNTGMILYWQQVSEPAYSIDYKWLFIALAAINTMALALRELGVLRGMQWLKGKWLRAVILVAVLSFLTVPVMALIFDYYQAYMLVDFLFAIPWLLAMFWGYRLYCITFKDINSTALIVLNICVILLSLIGKVVFDVLDCDEFGGLFIFSVIVLTVMGGAAYWLKRVSRKIKNSQGGIVYE